MRSFTARLLVAASVVLIAFLGLTGLVLDQAFRDSALTAVQDRLQAQVYILLGAAKLDQQQHLQMTDALPEARFSTPGSGLYAQVLDQDKRTVWRSTSMLGVRLAELPQPQRPGVALFIDSKINKNTPVFTLGFSVSWQIAANQYNDYTFWIIETQDSFQSQVGQFRTSLWFWLLAATVVLLLVQGIILRWSLQPLRQVAREVNEIETGQRQQLDGEYPTELQALTRNLNQLIKQSHAHLERYRNALGDLAHSLKTPLAVLRSANSDSASLADLQVVVATQVERMNQTVDYQLQRAAASGRVALSAPIALAASAAKVLDSLDKVYRDKHLQLELDISETLHFQGDEGDLLEILGNLADNACKWAKQQVLLSAEHIDNQLIITVEDDGHGIDAEQQSLILGRGHRADENVPGHGIGLAIVRDIVEQAYRGQLSIAKSRLGGALIKVTVQY